MYFSTVNIIIIGYMDTNNQIKHTYCLWYVYDCNKCLNKLPVVFVDKDDTAELITVEITVEDGEDTEMIKIICNIIVLQTEISNFMSYI